MTNEEKIARIKVLHIRLEEIKKEEGILETERGFISIELKTLEDPNFSGWVK